MLPEIRGAILLTLKPLALLNISALKREGLEPLMRSIAEHCPEGPALYPAEIYTDQSPGFRISEIIREKALGVARNELPHSIYVEIADLEFRHSKPENNNSAAYSPTPPLPPSIPPDFSGENTATSTSGKLMGSSLHSCGKLLPGQHNGRQQRQTNSHNTQRISQGNSCHFHMENPTGSAHKSKPEMAEQRRSAGKTVPIDKQWGTPDPSRNTARPDPQKPKQSRPSP